MKKKPVNWKLEDIPDLSGQTVLITGANSGLGLQAAKVLSGHGAHVVMACRNEEKGRDAMDLIRAEYPKADLALMQVDLADLASVRCFADAFRERYDQLDVLFNNAGLMAPPLQRTRDGFEIQFGTNHLAHFLLTGLLLDRLEAAGAPRIVVLSSFAHRMGDIYFDNLHAQKGYSRWKFYGQSKLANLVFALELDRRLRERDSKIKVVPVHPGYSATGLQRTVVGGGLFNALVAQPQDKGALPGIFAATSELAESGQYYGPNGPMELRGVPAEASMRKRALDRDLAARLWSVSEQLTDIQYLDDDA